MAPLVRSHRAPCSCFPKKASLRLSSWPIHAHGAYSAGGNGAAAAHDTAADASSVTFTTAVEGWTQTCYSLLCMCLFPRGFGVHTVWNISFVLVICNFHIIRCRLQGSCLWDFICEYSVLVFCFWWGLATTSSKRWEGGGVERAR